MPPEVPLQRDMFTGELIDTRTRKQKQQAVQQTKPKQLEMFQTREIVHFGDKAKAKAQLPHVTADGRPLRLGLAMLDPRSEADKEYDRQKAAEKATYALFADQPAPQPQPEVGEEKTIEFPSGLRFPLVEILLDVATVQADDVPEAEVDAEPGEAESGEGQQWGVEVEIEEVEALEYIEPEPAFAIQLAEGVTVPYWASRNVAANWLEATVWNKGYHSYPQGREALEVWNGERTGWWQVQFSGQMIANIVFQPA